MKAYNETTVEIDKKKGTIITHLTSPANLKHVLMTFYDKMSQEEIDDMFEEFELDDDGNILTKSIVDYLLPEEWTRKRRRRKKRKLNPKLEVAMVGMLEQPRVAKRKRRRRRLLSKLYLDQYYQYHMKNYRYDIDISY